ncbi:hypothetical protein D3C87_947860 [compost metagenome]
MAIIDLEGFERLVTGVIPAAPTASAKVLDAFGWIIAPGDPEVAAYPDYVVAIEVSEANAYRRGKAITISPAKTAWAAYAGKHPLVLKPIPMASFNKVVVGFNLFIHSSTSTASPDASIIRFGPSLTGTSYAGNTFAMTALSTGAIMFAGVQTPGALGSFIGKWAFHEIVLDKTAGRVDWYVNGNLIGGAATPVATFNSIQAFNAGPIGGTYVTQMAKFTVDDIYVADLGTDPTRVLGRGKVDIARPNETVSAAFATNGSEQNWQNLDVPVNLATYNSSPTEGAVDIIGLDNPLASSPADDIVLAVVTSTLVRTSTGQMDVVVGTGIGSTFNKTTVTGVTTTPTGVKQVNEVNPATGQPWTVAEIADLRTGYAVKTWP